MNDYLNKGDLRDVGAPCGEDGTFVWSIADERDVGYLSGCGGGVQRSHEL